MHEEEVQVFWTWIFLCHSTTSRRCSEQLIIIWHSIKALLVFTPFNAMSLGYVLTSRGKNMNLSGLSTADFSKILTQMSCKTWRLFKKTLAKHVTVMSNLWEISYMAKILHDLKILFDVEEFAKILQIFERRWKNFLGFLWQLQYFVEICQDLLQVFFLKLLMICGK